MPTTPTDGVLEKLLTPDGLQALNIIGKRLQSSGMTNDEAVFVISALLSGIKKS